MLALTLEPLTQAQAQAQAAIESQNSCGIYPSKDRRLPSLILAIADPKPSPIKVHSRPWLLSYAPGRAFRRIDFRRILAVCEASRITILILRGEGRIRGFSHPHGLRFYGGGTDLGRLRAIAWNPLGNLVATGSMDKTLRVCEFLIFT